MSLQFPVTPQDHAQGDPSASVTIVHYGDFECPFSGRAHPSIQRVQTELGDNVRYVFRHFPLWDVHPHALNASLAAEAAAAQDKFWPMYHLLFVNQRDLEDDDLLGYASHLGLDMTKFASDLQSSVGLDVIQQTIKNAKSMGVHGTPTLFINDRFHDNREGLWNVGMLMQAVSDAMP